VIDGRRWNGDEWRWHLEDSGSRSSISVIEPAKPREIPEGARTIAFGFSRALEQETIDGLEQWDHDHDHGWSDHAEMVAG
jgi:hypothetical protein